MNNLLLVIDMQNDFITGALGTPEAAAILPKVREKLASFNGRVLFTRDTHGEDYLDTREGKLLPVPHCIGGTKGWEIEESLQKYALKVFDKPTFGSLALAERLVQANREQKLDEVQLIGLCTDICV
ncbi:MAG: isochorismatase family cysteine hydrolase, partial [Oscillospiraceae bacterium]